MKLKNTMQFLIKKPEWLFAAIASLVGIIFCFIVPPMYVPDEPAHFYKAYSIYRGSLVQKNLGETSGGYVSEGIAKFAEKASTTRQRVPQNYHYRADTKELAAIKLGDKLNQEEFPNFSAYSPVAYIPQVIGITIGNILSDRVIVLFYMARLFNLGVFILLGFFAIKTIMYGKWGMLAIGLLPISLFLTSSLSADAFTIGTIMLFTAFVMKGFQSRSPLTGKYWICLLLISLSVVLSKQAYFMLVPMLAVLLFSPNSNIPLRDIPDTKKRLIMVLAIGLISAGALTLWMFATKDVSNDVSISQAAIGYYTDSDSQTNKLLHQPADFISKMINSTFSIPGDGIIGSALGTFGWLDVYTPLWIGLIITITLFVGFGLDGNSKNNLGWLPCLVIILSVIGVYVVIMAALYVYWTLPEATSINGFQGRYMVPLLIALTPVLAARYHHSIKKTTVVALLLIILALAGNVIGSHY